MRLSELKIDPDFRDCLPRLTDEEYGQLEENILEYGIQSPLIIWHGYIIDGHNRYSIAFTNNIIDVPVREEYFESKDDALQWILENQLGRRNLTDFGRNEIALRYKAVIARKAKENQSKGGKVGANITNGVWSNDQKPTDTVNTRTEIAKIAGTNDSSVKRTEFILKHGNDEEKARARQGGKGNSQGTIVREVKKRITPEGMKMCMRCKEIKPLDEFFDDGANADGKASWCKKCNVEGKKERYAKKTNGSSPESNTEDLRENGGEMTIPQIKKMLKDESAVPVVTENHIMEMVNANIDNFIKSISSVISMNESSFDSCKEKVKATIIARISEFCEERI